MTVQIAILGASGFVGGELLRLCVGHPDFAPVRLFGDSQAGAAIDKAHPHLALAYPGMRFETYEESALDGIDLVFAALPHGASQAIAGTIIDRDIAFVDLGADFRLRDPAVYETWYGEPHRAPDLLGHFVYGIPEIARAEIAKTRCVAAAGCYPTATILALKPLVDAGLIDPKSIIVDAASGVSGAGRGLKESTHFNAIAESYSAYGLVSHRHTAEMEASLGATVLFTPHLAPMNRGILATCYGTATGPMAADAPLEALRAAYADEPFVHVSETPPSTKWTLGSNAAHITARYDPRTGRVLAISAIDNLVKGAAGQMIQCANIMLGLDETAGLGTCGVHP
ncbi:N-acetyl-gamma-glutamyl-phosphate reductase [Sphingosinicella rhizophila]|uniref:N-acetyl-gamma-glutamyl-phosphate reductase n=1 Tax=Sphingosinicella rhizophila TaxID=3050082 RepID=A0ABU3QBR9_9SPHN|nr:N-acetyl-gamma-glutamyl-phosphate reductase [Sphingosinicella sp. GR2756]MDT9600824.1 N-acetyl-gamma-glutamyl-phosphate reductase [Sphingosinicella sp. GR2756]